ncbi:DVU_1556 family methyltransferase [Pleomorphomonas sp. JP5]|uniref:DVU_1556 family methyltransferase n=1 Tax=Pleomorphomonas sp. JP5 TaxID=2942998 RepID=UPI00204391D9|nr:methyltransferase domain-containing protein [Pleomorphomonas sp. JP5]MCM5558399.1 class I SAM-dependent methyltransferase [Pleomorphomonas sp. JP5]
MTANPTSFPGLFGCGRVEGATGEWLRPGDGEIVRELFERSGLRLGAKVLDVGCGTGESLAWLERHGYSGIGVDRDERTLAIAASRVQSALFHGDGARLPFADACLDAVLSECSLSQMTDRRAALGEWWRIVRPGGRLLLADVDWPSDDGRDGLREDVEAAGFAILHHEDRSKVLAGFVARFIFHYGSLDPLWGGRDCSSTDRRPRYRLLVAERAAEPTGSAHP